MIKILHIIQGLTRGGAGRSLIATAKYSARSGDYQHQVISLVPAQNDILDLMQGTGLSFLNAPNSSEIVEAIQETDIVQVHFWNNPHIYEFLRSHLPSMRLLIWVHCAGNLPPQIVTQRLVERSDRIVGCSPYTRENLLSLNLPSEEQEKIGMVFAGTDFQRLLDTHNKTHNGFNIGYLGTVDFVKMHPDYISMSGSLEITDAKIITVGKGRSREQLKQQVAQLGLESKFEFIEYIEDPKTILEILDVFGYPLCEETYAASELVLQETMYCGVPPVVFPYGGVKRLVIHNQTGLVVNSPQEYKEAIEYLYHHPEERARLGKNAREYAREYFGAENAIQQLHPIYEKMMQQPKQKRIWGMPVASTLLEKSTGKSRFFSGAECFVESLADTAQQFKISLTSENIDKLLESDRKIACSSPLLQRGVSNYYCYYPYDAYLKLWSGLIAQQLGQYTQAISEFSGAIALGFYHWRILWYLARAAEQAGNQDLAKQMLIQLWKVYPNLAIARDSYTRLFNCPVFLLPLKFSLDKIIEKLLILVKSPKHFVKLSLISIRDRFNLPIFPTLKI